MRLRVLNYKVVSWYFFFFFSFSIRSSTFQLINKIEFTQSFTRTIKMYIHTDLSGVNETIETLAESAMAIIYASLQCYCSICMYVCMQCMCVYHIIIKSLLTFNFNNNTIICRQLWYNKTIQFVWFTNFMMFAIASLNRKSFFFVGLCVYISMISVDLSVVGLLLVIIRIVGFNWGEKCDLILDFMFIVTL